MSQLIALSLRKAPGSCPCWAPHPCSGHSQPGASQHRGCLQLTSSRHSQALHIQQYNTKMYLIMSYRCSSSLTIPPASAQCCSPTEFCQPFLPASGTVKAPLCFGLSSAAELEMRIPHHFLQRWRVFLKSDKFSPVRKDWDFKCSISSLHLHVSFQKDH